MKKFINNLFPKGKPKQNYLKEVWRITWDQLCRGKPPYGSSSDDRLTVLVFWPLFATTFIFVAIYVAVKRIVKKDKNK